MIDVLEPLSDLPGVELAMLVTEDGVPMAVSRSGSRAAGEESEVAKENALAALAIGWSNELQQATAPLSWDLPSRVVLRCARGSIVLRRMRGAMLLLELARGVAPEDVRLSMDGTVARIERSLRGVREQQREEHPVADPPGPIPRPRTDLRLAEPSSNNTKGREGHPGN